MQIDLKNIGKKFGKQWIFRQVDLMFEKGKSYAILGANGSGKSTLLQVISGFIVPSEGDVNFSNGSAIAKEKMFKEVACAAPYMEIYDELNLKETLEFQGKFKAFYCSIDEVIEDLDLPTDKAISTFSSGMRQKVKLALALYADVPVLLLDEPTSNLDANAKKWYSEKVSELIREKLVIVCSNYQELEYSFAREHIKIENFKPQN